jgi:hypothetical protein
MWPVTSGSHLVYRVTNRASQTPLPCLVKARPTISGHWRRNVDHRALRDLDDMGDQLCLPPNDWASPLRQVLDGERFHGPWRLPSLKLSLGMWLPIFDG